jgi:hypothetical protein
MEVELDAVYETENPRKITMKVEVIDDGNYGEVCIDFFEPNGNCIAHVVAGTYIYSGEEQEVRIATTVSGRGDEDISIAVFPERPKEEAVDLNWN